MNKGTNKVTPPASISQSKAQSSLYPGTKYFIFSQGVGLVTKHCGNVSMAENCGLLILLCFGVVVLEIISFMIIYCFIL